MSYQALYRVWRPQLFFDVVGQEHVTKTLQNALLQEKISHAYLFSGPRGTGKTTAAKIFAKAVNCENSPTQEPCNQCSACLGITNGTISDVIEIDAASNNGVDEIRDIRDKVKYAPSSVKYKVYIIDEVHMLSIGAFNALLKTLEEPPSHVIFILATTEPHKIPLTILSRCQRFDFKRITSQSIVGRLKLIVDETGVSCEEQALQIVARAADGGMRDALSLLDQAISYGQNGVTAEEALTVTGAVSQDFLNALARAIKERDVVKGLEALEELLFQGKDPSRFIEDFILYYRDLLLYKTAPNIEESLERVLLDDDFQEITSLVDENEIYEIIEVLNKAQQEMRWTNHPRIFLEVAIIKLCQLSKTAASTSNEEIQKLFKKIADLEHQLEQVKEKGILISSEDSTVSKPKPQRSTRKGFQVSTGKIHEILRNATKTDLNLIKGQWGEMLSGLAQKQMRSQAALLNEAEPVAASSDAFVIKFKYEIHCQMAMENTGFLQALGKLFEELTGKMMGIVGIPEDQWQQVREDFLKGHQEDEGIELVSEQKQEEDPVVAEAVKLFGDTLIEIKD